MKVIYKVALIVIGFILSNYSINLESNNIFSINFNVAYAADDDDEIEVITISGSRYKRPAYITTIRVSELNVQSYWDLRDDVRAEYYEDLRDECEALSWKKPLGCSLSNLPNLQPDGCSTEFAGVDFFNYWDGIFVTDCNQHDQCFTDLNGSYSACNEKMRQSMLDTCSEKNSEAIANGLLFQTSECWSKTSEYFIGVNTPIGKSKYTQAQKGAACVHWGETYIDGCY